MIKSKKNANIFLMMNQMIKNNFQEYFMNEYELLVSEVQKKAPVIETDLFQYTGCYGLYRDGRIYIEKSLSLSEKRNEIGRASCRERV